MAAQITTNNSNAENTSQTWLIYGSTGWIGQQIVKLLTEVETLVNSPAISTDQWPSKFSITVVCGKARLENVHDVTLELDQVKPDRVFNCAGLTGRPNVDWCEDHKQEVIRVNVIGTLALTDACYQRKIHVTHMATGCIYSYDETHQLGSGVGFTEQDKPNFDGSFYSQSKGYVDQLLLTYDNVLVLRLRMPISADLNPRSFVTKITQYQQVVNIPNSMSVLPDLLPVGVNMAFRGLTGTYNYVNPGVISHNEVLDLYTKYVDPGFTYINFTEEEQSKILKAGRSNNQLNADKLLAEYPNLLHIHDAVRIAMRTIGHNKEINEL